MSQQLLLSTESGRQRALAAGLNLAKGTSLEPKAYERLLLDLFVRGELTLDQVLERLEEQA